MISITLFYIANFIQYDDDDDDDDPMNATMKTFLTTRGLTFVGLILVGLILRSRSFLKLKIFLSDIFYQVATNGKFRL